MKFKFGQFLFDEDDGTGSGGAPEVQSTPDPVPEVVPEPQPGPWASDLESYFDDPQVRAQADRFLRERVQPRVTQIEQERSEYAPARELYDDLRSDPETTLRAITGQLYGDDVAEAIAKLLDEGETEPGTPEAQPAPELPREVQELIAERNERLAAEAYEAELARVKQQIPDLVEDEFHPFVVSAQGNMDKAVAVYQRWRQGVEERYGTPSAAQDPPPAALGSEGSSPVAPPVQQKYDSLDAALDATMDDLRRARDVTPVGTV